MSDKKVVEIVFTSPGKLGDAVLQMAVPYWYAKEQETQVSIWLDKNSCRPLVPLLERQSWVKTVELKEGVENYNCGGQPFHMNLATKDFFDRQIFHLGMRGFPQRQITLQTVEDSKVPLEVSQDNLAETPYFEVPPVDAVTVTKDGRVQELRLTEGKRVLVLHGQAVCPHTRSTPAFWRFLHRIRKEVSDLFDEMIWVGNDRDRQTGISAYSTWASFDDGGSFLELARLISKATAVIGVGSSVVTLGAALKVPTIRVHDQIGDHPRAIWDNLGSNQLNRPEVDLRKDWPEWRDRWVKAEVNA